MHSRNPTLNRRHPLDGVINQQGQPGSQSGPRPDTERLFQQEPGLGGMAEIAGQQGSQSGPVEESTSAAFERFLQMLASVGVGSAGGAAGYIAGGPIGGAVGVSPGVAGIANGDETNIQNVWAHQAMQALRRKMRGLE